jgi:membrane-associated phospholipid phosphatase
MLAQAGDGGAALTILLAVGGVAAAVMAFALRQTRRGRWGHIDAVDPSERRSFNLVALLVLSSTALIAGFVGAIHLALGLGCGALVLAAAIALAHRLKLSQHVAFAVLAAVIAQHLAWWAVAGVGTLAVGVAWSRLKLGRHTGAELVAGAVVGLAAGLLFVALGALIA